MRKTAVYVRVSTQEQAMEGYSIGEQKERLTAYCKAHDWLVSKVYADGGYSGANLKRPGIQSLMNEIKNFDVVLVYKLDRLSRSQRDTLYLIEEIFLPNRVDFVSMQESFDTSSPFGKAMIGLLAVFAQLEREQIKERTMMGKLARAKSGFYKGGGCVPIGYDYKDGKLVINPYEAEFVRKMFKWYLEGVSIIEITNRINDIFYKNNIKPLSTVGHILNNAVYVGTIEYGGVVVENAHEAIIDVKEFKEVQAERLKRKLTYSTNGGQSTHLLA